MLVRLFATLVLLGWALGATALADDPPAPTDAPLRVSAPHALMALVTGIAKEYTSLNGQDVTVSEVSSNAAAAALRAGTIDVALSDSGISDIAFHDTTVVAVPFAIVANTAAGVTALPAARIKALFDRKGTSWKDFGGANVPVTTVERPKRSATELLLESTFTLDPARHADTIEDASGSVIAAIRTTPGGVGIVGLPFAGVLDGVTVVKIGDALPDAKAIGTQAYPLFAFEHAVTLTTSPLSSSRFVAFLTSQNAVWRQNGFIPIRDLR
jgi:phosphate transport system substrate-binding protein